MFVTPLSANAAASSGAGLAQSAALGEEDFLTLLVEQLRFQDPLEPMDNQEFVAQVVQLSSLERLQDLNGAIGNLATWQRGAFAAGALGCRAEYTDELGELHAGTVQEIRADEEGGPEMIIDGVAVPLDRITSLSLPDMNV